MSAAPVKKCAQCGMEQPKSSFSSGQLKKKGKAKCLGCTAAAADGGAAPAAPAAPEEALDDAALLKREQNRKKKAKAKAKREVESMRAQQQRWVDAQLVALRAKRAEIDALPPAKAVYPYQEWLQGGDWTGPLRPSFVTPQRSIAVDDAEIARPDYADDEEGVPHEEEAERTEGRRGATILHASPEEIEGLRVACRLGREVLDLAALAVQPGVRTDEIDAIVHAACLERKCYPSPLNYRNFPKSVCTSVNEVICHGVPDTRVLQEGDICNIDVTVYFGGYHGDLNETYFVGTVDDESRHLVQTAYECLMKGIECVKPTALYRQIGGEIESHAKAKGCSVVRTYCGHGINHLFHTAPNIPHYEKNKAVGIIKPGHTFTIEPMINAGTWHDKHWPDQWTAVTADGKRSSQFEHTMLVTENGVELLTARLPHSRSDVTTAYLGDAAF